MRGEGRARWTWRRRWFLVVCHRRLRPVKWAHASRLAPTQIMACEKSPHVASKRNAHTIFHSLVLYFTSSHCSQVAVKKRGCAYRTSSRNLAFWEGFLFARRRPKATALRQPGAPRGPKRGVRLTERVEEGECRRAFSDRRHRPTPAAPGLGPSEGAHARVGGGRFFPRGVGWLTAR